MKQKSLAFRSALHERIVLLIAEYGYITYDEISFLTNSCKKATDTLYYLRKQGIVSSFSTRLNPAYAYVLTARTKTLISSAGLVDFIRPFSPDRYKTTVFYHDTALIKAHILFEKILGDRFKKYISSFRLVREQSDKKICDAEIHYTKQDQDKIMALELELSLKSKENFAKQTEALARQAGEKYSGVIIIYSMPAIKERWQKALKMVPLFDVPYFFIQYAGFIRDREKCRVEDLDGNSIPLL